MITNILKTLTLTSCIALCGNTIAAPVVTRASVSSEEQGMHQWPALNGKLILINGTYLDVLTYKRSLTFYFAEKPGGDWSHVPIVESETERTLTWFSVSQGEQTVADGAVVPDADGVQFVVAETKPSKAAAITVQWYRFSRYKGDDPNSPAYVFKKTSRKSYPAKAELTVEDVLKKEISSKVKK